MMQAFPGRFDGRAALVTGGAKGVGAAIARRIAAEGARVTVADLDEVSARKLQQETGCDFIRLDVCDPDGVMQAFSGGAGFDIVVNNAGIDQHSFFTNTSPEEWRRLLHVNLESVFSVCRATLPAMQAKGYGRIVNIGSEAARLGSKGGSVYAATKGAMIAFTKSLAIENARYGVTANVIAPGPISTPLLHGAVERGGDGLLRAMIDSTLLKRLGTPEEVAAAVAFIASEEASFITGETIGVSGGMPLA